MKDGNMGFKVLFGVFYGLIIIISATTSFSFWFQYFGNLIPAGIMSDFNRWFIAGLVGVILFDIASLIWLWAYLLFAENSEQRWISQTMVVITFVGATTASVFHLITSSPLGETILNDTFATRLTWVSLIFVILGVAANFGAGLLFSRFSETNQTLVREGDRAALEIKTRREGEQALDEQMTKLLKQKLARMAPDLAEQQAQEIAAQFVGQEAVAKSVKKTETTKRKAAATRRKRVKAQADPQFAFAAESLANDVSTQKMCVECGENPAKGNGVYCSGTCRTRAWRRRQ